MSEFHAALFNERPSWSQGMMVLPDIVCIDVRLWVSSNRGFWSMASQVAQGLERDLVHLSVGADMPFISTQGPALAASQQVSRLLGQFVEPFPPSPLRAA